MTPRERLISLLAYYREAPLAHIGAEGRGETGPRLSAMWADSSYPELARWLSAMRTCVCIPPRPHRTGCTRPMFHHLRQVHIDAERRTVDIPLRRGKLILPAGCTLVASQTPSLLTDGTQTARAVVMRVNPQASRSEAERGLQWLLEHMYRGDSSRITLPEILRSVA